MKLTKCPKINLVILKAVLGESVAMQIKKIEDLTKDELAERVEALYPLCGWGEYINSDEELFHQDQCDLLTDRLIEIRQMEVKTD